MPFFFYIINAVRSVYKPPTVLELSQILGAVRRAKI